MKKGLDISFAHPDASWWQRRYTEGYRVFIQCAWCVTPETRILTEDLRWIAAGDLAVGDGLLAFEEFPTQEHGLRPCRTYQWAKVTHQEMRKAPIYTIWLDNGDILKATGEHQWIVCEGAHNFRWRRTDDLHRSMSDKHRVRPLQIARYFEPWESDNSWQAGYLAGALDGEGHLSIGLNGRSRIGFTQKDNPMLEGVVAFSESLLREAQWKPRYREKTGFSNSGVYELRIETDFRYVIETLGKLHPLRLMRKFLSADVGRKRLQKFQAPAIIRVEPTGIEWVAALSSSSQTYFAEGYGAHNTGGYAGNSGILAVCEDNLRNARLSGFECGAYVNATPPDWWPDSTAITEIKKNMGAEWAQVQNFIIDMEIDGLTQARAFSLADALIAEGKTCDIGYTALWFWDGHMNGDADPAWLRFKLLNANYSWQPGQPFGQGYGPWTEAAGVQKAGTVTVDGFDVDLDEVEDDFLGAAPTPVPIPPVGDDDMDANQAQQLADLHAVFLGEIPDPRFTDGRTIPRWQALETVFWVLCDKAGGGERWGYWQSMMEQMYHMLFDGYSGDKSTDDRRLIAIGQAVKKGTDTLNLLPAAQLTHDDIAKIQAWAAKQK